jgi:DNA polymerase-3 subunit epsilon
MFGMLVIAFNASFDWTVLDQDLRRNGLLSLSERLGDRDPVSLLDPFVIDKGVDRYRRGKRKLAVVCEHYGVELKDWHTADADAWAALRVMDAIADQYPELGEMGPAELFKTQQAWAASQAESLQSYFRSEKAGDAYDPNKVIDGSWPLKAAP